MVVAPVHSGAEMFVGITAYVGYRTVSSAIACTAGHYNVFFYQPVFDIVTRMQKHLHMALREAYKCTALHQQQCMPASAATSVNIMQ